MLRNSPLLPVGRKQRGVKAGLLALGALALVGAAALVSGGDLRSVLDFSQVDVNCDGSVDITTIASTPCAYTPGILPTTLSYTSYLPSMMPYAPYAGQPLAPTVLAPPPQPWGAPPVPVGPNAYQYATVWQGDHVLSGGQPEWAAEDAAQHALNLDNWRIKILHAKKQQAALSGDIQRISGQNTDTQNDNGVIGYQNNWNRGGRNQGVGHKKWQPSEETEEAELSDIRKSVASLAFGTTQAISALAKEVDKEGRSTPQERQDTQALRRGTDEEMGRILKQLAGITNENENEAAEEHSEEREENYEEEAEPQYVSSY